MWIIIGVGGFLILMGLALLNFEGRTQTGFRLCAWCGKNMGHAPGKFNTHGICDRCAYKMKAKVIEEAEKQNIRNYERVAIIIMEDK